MTSNFTLIPYTDSLALTQEWFPSMIQAISSIIDLVFALQRTFNHYILQWKSEKGEEKKEA